MEWGRGYVWRAEGVGARGQPTNPSHDIPSVACFGLRSGGKGIQKKGGGNQSGHLTHVVLGTPPKGDIHIPNSRGHSNVYS